MFLDPRFKYIHFFDPIAASKVLMTMKKLSLTMAVSPSNSSDSEDAIEPNDDLWFHHKSLAQKNAQKCAVHQILIVKYKCI